MLSMATLPEALRYRSDWSMHKYIIGMRITITLSTVHYTAHAQLHSDDILWCEI